MDAQQFITKVWFPVGMLAVAVSFVLAFLREEHASDNLIALIIGSAVIGLPVLYGTYRWLTGARSS